MNVADYDYYLPKELIAQSPGVERSASTFLVLNRADREIRHGVFTDLTGYLREGDTLVLNETRVFPAKLVATKKTGGKVDILLVQKTAEDKWKCLAGGVKRGAGEIPVLLGSESAILKDEGSFWSIRFLSADKGNEIIQTYGRVPLPPYIKRNGADGLLDATRYQTVYARAEGSIAAPTAGFHFTGSLLEKIEAMGVSVIKIVLHIGVGTFFLIKTERVEDHRMHEERYEVTPEALESIRSAKAEGRRVVACGTSVVRAIETVFSENGRASPGGSTTLYIHPGYKFRVVDAMITNFHLPRSTPLMMVSALAGKETILDSYREAMDRGYRFYSYGDAMLIL